jgi:hypothetical protein
MLGFLPILESMLFEEDMYFQHQLTLCFKFCASMMVYLTIHSVFPLFLCCEDIMANDVVLLLKRSQCFMSFFPLLHRQYIQASSMQYGFFFNATTITTWIDLCELGCIYELLAMVYFLFLSKNI